MKYKIICELDFTQVEWIKSFLKLIFEK